MIKKNSSNPSGNKFGSNYDFGCPDEGDDDKLFKLVDVKDMTSPQQFSQSQIKDDGGDSLKQSYKSISQRGRVSEYNKINLNSKYSEEQGHREDEKDLAKYFKFEEGSERPISDSHTPHIFKQVYIKKVTSDQSVMINPSTKNNIFTEQMILIKKTFSDNTDYLKLFQEIQLQGSKFNNNYKNRENINSGLIQSQYFLSRKLKRIQKSVLSDGSLRKIREIDSIKNGEQLLQQRELEIDQQEGEDEEQKIQSDRSNYFNSRRSNLNHSYSSSSNSNSSSSHKNIKNQIKQLSSNSMKKQAISKCSSEFSLVNLERQISSKQMFFQIYDQVMDRYKKTEPSNQSKNNC